jgi:uncharacterized protein (DUF433 family)/predicted nuclease of predicted toxin-antitoxin system
MHEGIEINAGIMLGKPVIRGTRITVELILRKLGAGMTPEQIIADHPHLRTEDIRAAQAFAADYLADEEILYGWAAVVRLLFDECVDVGLADHLRTCGHDVVLVQDIERGAEDQRVVSLAAELERVLVTEDKDFGELAVRQRRPLPGVVLLRIAPSRRQVKAARLEAVLARRAGRIAGSYTVVQEDKIRIRPLTTKR